MHHILKIQLELQRCLSEVCFSGTFLITLTCLDQQMPNIAQLWTNIFQCLTATSTISCNFHPPLQNSVRTFSSTKLYLNPYRRYYNGLCHSQSQCFGFYSLPHPISAQNCSVTSVVSCPTVVQRLLKLQEQSLVFLSRLMHVIFNPCYTQVAVYSVQHSLTWPSLKSTIDHFTSVEHDHKDSTTKRCFDTKYNLDPPPPFPFCLTFKAVTCEHSFLKCLFYIIFWINLIKNSGRLLMNENQCSVFIVKETDFYLVAVGHCFSIAKGPKTYEAISSSESYSGCQEDDAVSYAYHKKNYTFSILNSSVF